MLQGDDWVGLDTTGIGTSKWVSPCRLRWNQDAGIDSVAFNDSKKRMAVQKNSRVPAPAQKPWKIRTIARTVLASCSQLS